MKSKVFFTKEITPGALIKLFNMLNVKLEGNVAVKLHSGEKGNQNFLKPSFFKPIIDEVDGTVVECNTAYEGSRNTTEVHMKTMKEHGWSTNFKVDLMDADGEIILPIPNGKIIKQNYVGKNIKNYDSMLVLSHFKGHPMGGFGGALKQLAIGCASSKGKAYIHTAGVTIDTNDIWGHIPENDLFLESMADAASSIHGLFAGKIAYINVMKNMSVDCDCCSIAEDPCMDDIGVLASLDPVAIDQACIDLVLASNDHGKEHFMERVNSRNGTHILDAASELGFGSKDYELIEL